MNEWISVEDKLPDDCEDVLVWYEYFRYGEYNCLFQRCGIGKFYENTQNWLINGETRWRQLRVIAWQYLPEPPAKESDAE